MGHGRVTYVTVSSELDNYGHTARHAGDIVAKGVRSDDCMPPLNELYVVCSIMIFG